MFGGKPAAAALPMNFPSGPMQLPCWEDADAAGAVAVVSWLASGPAAALGLSTEVTLMGAGAWLCDDEAAVVVDALTGADKAPDPEPSRAADAAPTSAAA